jgi:four helix bundle protein
MNYESKEKNMEEFSFKKTDLYKKILNFIDMVYRITKTYPKDELYHLVSQFRRASTSVLLNYTEGWGRYNKGEKKQFFRTSRASIHECVAIIEISYRQKYFMETEKNKLYNNCLELSKMLNGLINKFKNNL